MTCLTVHSYTAAESIPHFGGFLPTQTPAFRTRSQGSSESSARSLVSGIVGVIVILGGLVGGVACAAAPDAASAQGGHWAFQPPKDFPLPLPHVRRAELVQNPLDCFILARIEQSGLEPAPPADKRTLLRRATFDLIGLPPAAEQVEAFAADDSPDAFAKAVDRLLASPYYGERWGRYWLDVARYADTKGYVYSDREERQFVHSHVYRDWVVRVLNEDLPYDQFLLLQIAGDQLVTPETRDSLAAMGFLTVGRRFAGNFYEVIDDRIDTLCRATLALTVNCARCHDHKFDPVLMADYYSLYSVFRGSYDQAVSVVDQPERTAQYIAFEQELYRRRTAFDEALRDASQEVLDRIRARTAEYLTAVLAVETLPTEHEYRILDASDLNPVFVRQWHDFLERPSGQFDPVFAPWLAMAEVPDASLAEQIAQWLSQFKGQLNRRVAESLDGDPPTSKRDLAQRIGRIFEPVHLQWQAALEAAKKGQADPPTRLPDEADEALRLVLYGPGSAITVPQGSINEIDWCFDEKTRVTLGVLQMKIDQWILQTPAAPPHAVYLVDRPSQPTARIFLNGNPATKGKVVPRQFLEILSGPNGRPMCEGSGRLELARAIASPENPLTARVLVNRVWLHHFGKGLVSTPSDFGLRSDPPTHPELLDWLARRFVADGWSLKNLHRLIMLSHTYQQSSRSDAASRRLDPENRFAARMNRRRLDYEAMRDSLLAVSGELDMRLGGRSEMVDDAVGGQRRSLYNFVDRLNVPSAMRVFDVASPDVHSPQRHVTTIPQQALYLLNSPFVIERARSLACRPEVTAAVTSPERVGVLYRLVFARRATARETELGVRLAEGAIAEPIVLPASPWQNGHGPFDATLRSLKEFQPYSHFSGAAWQSTAKPGDPSATGGMLTASGGHAASDPAHAVVRRWIAPRDAAVAVSGKIEHNKEAGDGVRGIILSSRTGQLGTYDVHHSSAETNLNRMDVKQGDTLDFLVLCRGDSAEDEFVWAPIIREEEPNAAEGPIEWNAAADFSGPPPMPLTPWEKYAQVLLLTNEFAFVD